MVNAKAPLGPALGSAGGRRHPDWTLQEKRATIREFDLDRKGLRYDHQRRAFEALCKAFCMVPVLGWLALPLAALWLRARGSVVRGMAPTQHVGVGAEELVHVVEGHFELRWGWCRKWVGIALAIKWHVRERF
eukprot:evm.model.scf_1547EXC.1 EVM.evm.TU.scf_1547EXC.1   scf_1547EXC:1422-2227(+)